MDRIKKIIVISIICSMVAIIAVAFGLFINVLLPETYSSLHETYSSAKKECEKVLAEHQTQMEEIAIDCLQSGESGAFWEYYYHYDAEGKCVAFDIDAQGMLGGQYWELVYTKDGTFCGETESYLYEETGGNNIRKAEKIDAHWWYLWTDYDGTERSYQ